MTVDAEHGDDVARGRLVDLLHLVGVHAHQPSDLVALAGPRVGDVPALGERPLVDAQVGELPVAAVLQLEGQHHERPARVALQGDLLLFLVQIDAAIGDLARVGQVVDDGVEQQLHALVLVGRAHHHRGDLQVDGRLAHGGPDNLLGDPVLEDGEGEVVGEQRERVEHLLACPLHVERHVGGDLGLDDPLPVGSLEAEGLLPDEIDDPLEPVLEADGELQEHGVQVELGPELVLDP